MASMISKSTNITTKVLADTNQERDEIIHTQARDQDYIQCTTLLNVGTSHSNEPFIRTYFGTSVVKDFEELSLRIISFRKPQLHIPSLITLSEKFS